MPPKLRGHPVLKIGFGSLYIELMSAAAPGPAVKLFSVRICCENRSLRRLRDFIVLLRFLLLISTILLLPGFSEMESLERRVLAGLVSSEMLTRAAILAKSRHLRGYECSNVCYSPGFPRVSGENRVLTINRPCGGWRFDWTPLKHVERHSRYRLGSDLCPKPRRLLLTANLKCLKSFFDLILIER